MKNRFKTSTPTHIAARTAQTGRKTAAEEPNSNPSASKPRWPPSSSHSPPSGPTQRPVGSQPPNLWWQLLSVTSKHISCCINMGIFITGHSPTQPEHRDPCAPLGLEVEPGKLFLLELFHPFLSEKSLIVFKKEACCFMHLIFCCSEGLQTDV